MSERTFWKCVACLALGGVAGYLGAYATKAPVADYQSLLPVKMSAECRVDRGSLMKGSHNTYRTKTTYTFTNTTTMPISLTFPPLATVDYAYDADGITPRGWDESLTMPKELAEPRTVKIAAHDSYSVTYEGILGTQQSFPSRRRTASLVFRRPPCDPSLSSLHFVGGLFADIRYIDEAFSTAEDTPPSEKTLPGN